MEEDRWGGWKGRWGGGLSERKNRREEDRGGWTERRTERRTKEDRESKNRGDREEDCQRGRIERRQTEEYEQRGGQKRGQATCLNVVAQQETKNLYEGPDNKKSQEAEEQMSWLSVSSTERPSERPTHHQEDQLLSHRESRKKQHR
ncbi:uncharacterized [Tachysurus ichikawai]